MCIRDRLNIEERPNELEKWRKLVPVRGPPDLNASIKNNQIKISAELIGRNSYFFPYDDQIVDFSVKQNFSDSTLSFATLDSFNGKVNGIISSESGFFEIDEQVSLQESVQESGISLLSAIIFALIGGLILNLMPCVLPVIALKALSLVKNANESRSSVTMNASAYVFGVILTFMVIASLLISFKNAGELIGWGYQLQSPFIVTLLLSLIHISEPTRPY